MKSRCLVIGLLSAADAFQIELDSNATSLVQSVGGTWDATQAYFSNIGDSFANKPGGCPAKMGKTDCQK